MSDSLELVNILVYEYLKARSLRVASQFLVEIIQKNLDITNTRNKQDRTEAITSYDDASWRQSIISKYDTLTLSTYISDIVQSQNQSSISLESEPSAKSSDLKKDSLKPNDTNCKDFKPRMSRIDVNLVKFHNETLKDNTPGAEAMNLLQNQKMMKVKGKDFNKQKQKNKSKIYAAGVDTSIRSVKFNDSD